MIRKTIVLLSVLAAAALCTAWIAGRKNQQPATERTAQADRKAEPATEPSGEPARNALADPSQEASATKQPLQLPETGAEYGFTAPLKIPMRLSANYGELRGGHFHAGIDIKTQGVINKPVFAVADGYIARVNVSPSGFGKAVYINHPNGTTTVYGHLERFSEPVEAYIHELQYSRKTFPIDIAPPEDRFVVKQGEQIGWSGDRGSSGGPHLHFEVREAASQRPLNVLARGILQIDDTIPSKPRTLYYIGIDTVQGIPIHTVRHKIAVRPTPSGVYGLQGAAPLAVSGTGYFAVEAEEKKNGTSNPMGVYTIEASKDSTPYFSMTVDRIGFELGRYSYAAALYPESRGTRNGLYRLCRLPNNMLPIYGHTVRRGILSFDDDRTHRIEIVLGDDCGNRSTLAFDVRREPTPDGEPPSGIPVRWDANYRYGGEGLHLSIPRGALYESILLRLQMRPEQSYSYSPLYAVHTPDVPLHKSISVGLDAQALPERLRAKALLGSVGANGQRTAVGGKWSEGKVSVDTRGFGTFYIAVDTVPPRITPAFKPDTDFGAQKTIAVKVSDDFSGIGSYSATIDGQWALFELDTKSGTLTHYFDDKRWERGKTHELVLTVSDNKGNRAVYKKNYKR